MKRWNSFRMCVYMEGRYWFNIEYGLEVFFLFQLGFVLILFGIKQIGRLGKVQNNLE